MYVVNIDLCILEEVMKGVDVFFGVLVKGVVIFEMVEIMVLDLLIFVMVNLDLEIILEEV